MHSPDRFSPYLDPEPIAEFFDDLSQRSTTAITLALVVHIGLFMMLQSQFTIPVEIQEPPEPIRVDIIQFEAPKEPEPEPEPIPAPILRPAAPSPAQAPTPTPKPRPKPPEPKPLPIPKPEIEPIPDPEPKPVIVPPPTILKSETVEPDPEPNIVPEPVEETPPEPILQPEPIQPEPLIEPEPIEEQPPEPLPEPIPEPLPEPQPEPEIEPLPELPPTPEITEEPVSGAQISETTPEPEPNLQSVISPEPEIPAPPEPEIAPVIEPPTEPEITQTPPAPDPVLEIDPEILQPDLPAIIETAPSILASPDAPQTEEEQQNAIPKSQATPLDLILKNGGGAGQPPPRPGDNGGGNENNIPIGGARASNPGAKGWQLNPGAWGNSPGEGYQGLILDIRCREETRTHEDCPDHILKNRGRDANGLENFSAHAPLGTNITRPSARTGTQTNPTVVRGRPGGEPAWASDTSGGPSESVLDDADFGRTFLGTNLGDGSTGTRVRDIFNNEEAPWNEKPILLPTPTEPEDPQKPEP